MCRVLGWLLFLVHVSCLEALERQEAHGVEGTKGGAASAPAPQ